jgi:hypothetical protein
LGEPRLEGAITSDICGKKDSHAVRLDKEAADSIKKARLHRKVATSIFFESNGGQTRIEATVPGIRLAVAEADLDIGNVETVLESLTLTADPPRTCWRFLNDTTSLVRLAQQTALRASALKYREMGDVTSLRSALPKCSSVQAPDCPFVRTAMYFGPNSAGTTGRNG